MAVGLAVVGTLVILKLVDVVIGLRVSPQRGFQGIHGYLHGEEGYNWEGGVP